MLHTMYATTVTKGIMPITMLAADIELVELLKLKIWWIFTFVSSG